MNDLEYLVRCIVCANATNDTSFNKAHAPNYFFHQTAQIPDLQTEDRENHENVNAKTDSEKIEIEDKSLQLEREWLPVA